MGSLTRKPGSDHNLFERKAASFLYSPGRLSEHLYEDRFANEGSSSRVSDYSLSSGGDPFKSAPQSPNLQTDDGFSSPTSDSSREIVDGLNRTYSETFAKRDIPLPRPQVIFQLNWLKLPTVMRLYVIESLLDWRDCNTCLWNILFNLVSLTLKHD